MATYQGDVVYLYAFDLAYEMTRQPLHELLGQPVEQFTVDASKPGPKGVVYYRPQMVRLPAQEWLGFERPLQMERTIKIFPTGAIGITVRLPFAVERLEELVAYHHPRHGQHSLHAEVLQLAETVRRELRPHLIHPVVQLLEEEIYTVFCLHTPLLPEGGAVDTAEWFAAQRRAIAGLLTEEPEPARLSEQEAAESTSRHQSYYRGDLVVVDWDAALIVDQPRYFSEALFAMELANLQLTEVKAYDRLLDEALERAYRDLREERWRSRRHVLRALRELRIDMARLSDEMSNTTKFFGDWHLARVYEHVSARFHLGDWHRTLDEKLATLDNLYQLLQQDQNDRWMMILEVAVLVLFLVDILFLILGVA